MAEIRLTLFSDLCAASGKGYAHTIDADICYDEYGIPFFPARRMKGCLREAAVYLYGESKPEIQGIFGETGKGLHDSIRIENGRLTDYEELKRELDSYPADRRPSPEQILQLFTSVRAQTAIDAETGTAKQESLRFTRVMNQYLPWIINGKQVQTVFQFPVICDEKYADTMKEICKALRHVGYKRTRGLGMVKAEYIHTAENVRENPKPVIAPDGTAVLPLCLRLDAPILMGSTDDKTVPFISGTALLGAVASLYLKKTPADEIFPDIFLKGKVRFSNLYISDGNGLRAEPAPAWMRKVKISADMPDDELKDGDIIYFDPEKKEDPKKKKPMGKPLKGKYAVFNQKNHDVYLTDVKMETTYHHTVSPDRMLYTQTALSAGQIFQGTITGPERLIGIIAELLNEYPLYIGKSKTAQYGRCTLIAPKNQMPTDEQINVKAGELLYFDLVSDVLLYTEDGNDDTDTESLTKLLLPDAKPLPYSAVSYRRIGGYNGKRNLYNIPRTAFAMGSMIAIYAPRDMTIPARFTIGDRQQEGFGEICCRPLAAIKEMKLNPSMETEQAKEGQTPLKTLLTGVLTETEMKREANQKALDIFEQSRPQMKVMTKSFIGRALLMLQQAEDFHDLETRIGSVKDKNKRKALEYICSPNRNEKEWRLILTTALRLMRYAARKEDEEE